MIHQLRIRMVVTLKALVLVMPASSDSAASLSSTDSDSTKNGAESSSSKSEDDGSSGGSRKGGGGGSFDLDSLVGSGGIGPNLVEGRGGHRNSRISKSAGAI